MSLELFLLYAGGFLLCCGAFTWYVVYDIYRRALEVYVANYELCDNLARLIDRTNRRLALLDRTNRRLALLDRTDRRLALLDRTNRRLALLDRTNRRLAHESDN